MGVAIVSVSAELWKLCASRPGEVVEVVSNDIPRDAELRAMTYHPYKDAFVIAVSSLSIQDTPEGESHPTLQGPIFRVYKKLDDCICHGGTLNER